MGVAVRTPHPRDLLDSGLALDDALVSLLHPAPYTVFWATSCGQCPETYGAVTRLAADGALCYVWTARMQWRVGKRGAARMARCCGARGLARCSGALESARRGSNGALMWRARTGEMQWSVGKRAAPLEWRVDVAREDWPDAVVRWKARGAARMARCCGVCACELAVRQAAFEAGCALSVCRRRFRSFEGSVETSDKDEQLASTAAHLWHVPNGSCKLTDS